MTLRPKGHREQTRSDTKPTLCTSSSTSVAIVTLGAGGSIDTESLTSPVVGFILNPAGLMYNLSLGGSKISRISR
jgi:lipid-binding SYLF domain-containing protein